MSEKLNNTLEQAISEERSSYYDAVEDYVSTGKTGLLEKIKEHAANIAIIRRCQKVVRDIDTLEEG